MRAALLVCVAACSPAPGDLRIDAAEPDHGPLGGGTRIVLRGDRFLDARGGLTRVLIGGRQAELAAPIDDTSLELVLPPGDRPGEVELVVFNGNGVASSTTAFHYAALPAVETILPAETLATGGATMTVTGSGFLDDGAGAAQLYLDGIPVENVTITSDTTLTFTAPPGRPLQRPQLELANTRGSVVRDRAFRYRPSMRPGLLLFARSSTTFATFFDPVDRALETIPRISPFFGMSAVIRDDDGEYRAVDPHGQQFGRLDLSTQRFEQLVPMSIHASAVVRVAGKQFTIDRDTQRFGAFAADGTFTPIGAATFGCCGSNGIAFDGTTLYYTYRAGADKLINTVDRETGAIGTPVKLLGGPGFHVEEMRFLGGKLYAASRDSTLVEIAPATGAVTVLAPITRSNAMEVFP